jgi:hypothetical protein
MATALAPDIRDWPSAAAVSGSALPPSGTLPASLRAIFPTAALQALEGLWLEIESHTLTPLLLSAPEEDLTRTFQLVYPRFMAYYVAASLALAASLEEPRLVSEVVHLSFDALENTLRTHGSDRLGHEPAMAARIGVRSMMRVFRAAARHETSDDTARERLEAMAAQWTKTTTAYMLTAFAVSHALSQGESFSGRWANVATLAIWSQAYARQVYELSVRHGLLRPPSCPPGQSPVVSTDGDLDLADAGLEDLIQFLKQD